MSDQCAIVAGKGSGFAPADVQADWKAQSSAKTVRPQAPKVGDLCQEMSDLFKIVAGGSFGTADDVKKSWTELSCKPNPKSP